MIVMKQIVLSFFKNSALVFFSNCYELNIVYGKKRFILKNEVKNLRAFHFYERFNFTFVYRFYAQLRATAAVIDIRNNRREGLFYDYLNPKASGRTNQC